MLTAYRVSDEMRKGTENRKISVGNSPMRESYPVGVQVRIHHAIELLTNQFTMHANWDCLKNLKNYNLWILILLI